MLNRIVLMGRLTANPELKSTTLVSQLNEITTNPVKKERLIFSMLSVGTTQQNLYVAILQKAI